MKKIHPFVVLVVVALCLIPIPLVPEGAPRFGFLGLALVAVGGLWLWDRKLEAKQQREEKKQASLATLYERSERIADRIRSLPFDSPEYRAACVALQSIREQMVEAINK